jgi:hypothetical protein
VGERVAAATQSLERRSGSARPRTRRGKPAPPVVEAPVPAQSLRLVFRELGDTHRKYRMRTGEAGTPALREAAHAFKREPSVAALASVAAHLDELGLLAW